MNAVKAMVMSETHPRLSISQSPTLYNAAFSSWIAPGSFVIGVLLAIEPANTITERARWEDCPVGGCEGWSVRGLGYGSTAAHASVRGRNGAGMPSISIGG